jgi:hypothetical protein
MLGLNLSRLAPPPLGHFHDQSPAGQGFKIRIAFADSPYYGEYMTDLIKDIVMLASGGLIRKVVANMSLVSQNVEGLLKEFSDLPSTEGTG